MKSLTELNEIKQKVIKTSDYKILVGYLRYSCRSKSVMTELKKIIQERNLNMLIYSLLAV